MAKMLSRDDITKHAQEVANPATSERSQMHMPTDTESCGCSSAASDPVYSILAHT